MTFRTKQKPFDPWTLRLSQRLRAPTSRPSRTFGTMVASWNVMTDGENISLQILPNSKCTFYYIYFLTKTSRRAPNEGAGPSPFKLEYLAVNKPLMSENLISYALTCLISAKKGDIFHQRFVIPTTYVST